MKKELNALIESVNKNSGSFMPTGISSLEQGMASLSGTIDISCSFLDFGVNLRTK